MTYTPTSVGTGSELLTAHYSGDNQYSPSGTTKTPDANTTLTVHPAAKFNVTFTQTGIGSDSGSNTVLTVGTTNYRAAQLPLTLQFNNGETVTYSYSNSDLGTGKRNVLTGTTGPASGFVASSDTTIAASYKTQYQVTFAQSGLSSDAVGTVVTVDGSAKQYADLSSFANWYDSGTALNYSFTTTIGAGTDKQYVLTTPDPTPASGTAISTAVTITGTYKAQYQVTFSQNGLSSDATGPVIAVDGANKQYTDLSFKKWYDSGTALNYSFTTTIGAGTDKQYVLTTPDPTPASGTAVSAAVTITGTYKAQYQVTFSQNGLGSDATGPVVAVDGANKQYTDLSFKKWYDSGTALNYSFTTTIGAGTDKQYVLTTPDPTPASGTAVAAAVTITGTYKPQWKVTFAQSGLGDDAADAVVTINGTITKTTSQLPYSGFFDGTVTYSFASPVKVGTDKQYVLTTPDPNPASGFTVSGAVTITGIYKTQWKVTFAQSGLDSDAVGTIATVGGADKLYAELPFSGWYDNDASLTYAFSNIVSAGTGKQYVLTTPDPTPASGTAVSAAVTITGNYKTQYQLTLAITSAVPGTLTNISGATTGAWYDAGSVLPLSANTPVADGAGKQWRFDNWSGDLTSTANQASLTMNGARSVTANYIAQYQVTFNATGLETDLSGNVVTVDGTPYNSLPQDQWYDVGTSVIFSYNDPIASTVAGKRYSLTGTDHSSPLTVNAATKVTANYKTQYEVKFDATGLGADTSGDIVTISGTGFGSIPQTSWYDAGANVIFSYNDPIASTLVGKRYTWNATDHSSPLTVSAATTVTASYKTQYQLTLAITSAVPGTLTNISGATTGAWYDAGSVLPLSANTPVADGAGKQWRFDNWSGDLTSTANQASLTMNGARSVTANYIAQYQVTFAQTGLTNHTGTSTVLTVNGVSKQFGALPYTDWFDAGSISCSYGSPLAGNTNEQFVLTSNPCSSGNVTGSAEASFTASYKSQYKLTFTADGLPLGSASATGNNTVLTVNSNVLKATNLAYTTDWLDSGTSVPYSFTGLISTDPVSDKQYELTNAASLTSPIAVSEPKTIKAYYTLNSYSIHYLNPLDDSTAQLVVIDTGKNGRVIPVKVEIRKNGGMVLAGDVRMRVAASNCAQGYTSDTIDLYADAGNSSAGTDMFRLADGFWIYNLDTKALGLATNTCYRLDVYFGTISGSTAIKLSNSTWAIFKPTK